MPHPRTPRRLLMTMPSPRLVRKAVAAGFTVWSVWDPSLRSDAYLDAVEEHSEALLLADFSDAFALRALIASAVRTHAVDLVLHLGEEAAPAAVSAEAEALGVAPNPPGAESRINDKGALRALLNSAGLSVVRAEEVDSVHDVLRAAAGFPVPFVVKPARASGSRGVALILDADDLDEWTCRVRRARLKGPFLMEEYLLGPEFGVESLTVDGVHHILGVSTRLHTGSPAFVATGHVFPASLSQPAESAIRATVIGLLDLAGHRFGPAHTQVVLTSRGPRIVASQTRTGDDGIRALLELATGYDVEAAALDALAGGEVAVPTAHRAAAVGFFSLPPGRLVSVSGIDELRAAAHVHRVRIPFRRGSVLPPTTDSGSRHGYVVVDAESSEQAAERITAARNTVTAVVHDELAAPAEGSTW